MIDATTLAEAFEQICRIDAPLSVRLEAYAGKLHELNLPFAEAYDRLVARLRDGDAGASAPAVGQPMPPFMLPSSNARLLSLEDLLTTGPAIISFNRGHWCPFCRMELKTIAGFESELAVYGAHVVSIMPDRQEFAQRVRAETSGMIHVLTDIDNGYALSLGLVMWLGDELKDLMQARGHLLETFQGNQGWYVPVPATFVVAQDGRIAARFVDPDFRKRMEIEEILGTLKAISMPKA